MKRATGGGKKNVKKSATVDESASAEVAVPAVTEVAAPAEMPAAAPPAAAPPAKPTRKRESKKKFPVVAIVTPDGIEGTFMVDQRRPLIAHLPIHSSEVVFHDAPLQYDPNPPVEPDPFDQGFEIYQTTSENVQHQDTLFEAAPVHLENATQSTAQSKTDTEAVTTTPPATPVTEPLKPFTKTELLVSYKNMQQTKTLPESSSVACFWCCHTFEGQPCIIPIREEKGIYEVYGNFCCPECALAYILDERDDSHVKWEKVSLLHRIYGPAVAPAGGRIYPAPARATLSMFGGSLTIDAYRKTVRAGKVRLDIHLPPMISILATMDTKPIDFYETTIPKSFVPLNSDRVQKVEEGLRLKRTKPLKDKESTLDAVMNLQIRRVPVVNPFAVSTES